MEKKIRAAIVGYGNIGKYALDAIEASGDMVCAGVVRRNVTGEQPAELAKYPVVKHISELKDVDVAILATPTRQVEAYAKECLALGINTVDSFDIHSQIVDLRRSLDAAAKEHGAVSVIAAGWDPGSDSVVRTLIEGLAPKGVSYTNFGPGRSMGHSVAVRAIDGVRDALSVTIPLGTGIHRRMVYVELEEGADFKQVAAAVKADPYFVNDETHVNQVEILFLQYSAANAQSKQGVYALLHKVSNQGFAVAFEIVNHGNLNHGVGTRLLLHRSASHIDEHLSCERRVIDFHVKLKQLIVRAA